jgi:site-specific DNA-cytosine methylase
VRAADGLARRLDNQQSVARKSSFGHYEMTEQAATLKSSGGDIGGGSENLAMTGYQTRADEKNGNFSITEAKVANSLSVLWPGDTSHRSMTLVAPSESILSFPSRFGSNANVTEGQAQSMAHSAGAPAVFRKSARAQTNEDSETWVEGDVANTLNSFDVGDVRTTHAIVGGTQDEDALLPVGLDSHRYRCCGNGVVAPVAEWIGRRIVEVDRRWREEGK